MENEPTFLYYEGIHGKVSCGVSEGTKLMTLDNWFRNLTDNFPVMVTLILFIFIYLLFHFISELHKMRDKLTIEAKK